MADILTDCLATLLTNFTTSLGGREVKNIPIAFLHHEATILFCCASKFCDIFSMYLATYSRRNDVIGVYSSTNSFLCDGWIINPQWGKKGMLYRNVAVPTEDNASTAINAKRSLKCIRFQRRLRLISQKAIITLIKVLKAQHLPRWHHRLYMENIRI